ncbi:MAG: hypothetical protein HY023_01825, partial [Chloroflexi bacterium]|nr:hypothetical protein [Chloroflexota bacterium]
MKRKHNRSGLAGLLLLSFISACASPAQLHSATSPPTIPPPQITATIQSSTETPPLARTPTLPPSPPLGPTTIGRVENFVQVGHNDLKSRGWNAGLALNYPCAYIGNRNPDIAIVDVSDPKNPSLVGELATPPNGQPVELRAVPDLGLLVVANLSPTASVLTYDVSDCRHPKPLGSLGLSAVPHEFF